MYRRIPIALMLSLATLVGVMAPPASAESDVITLVGTGTESPGLPITGCISNQTVRWTATLAIAAGDDAGTYAVSFNGATDSCASMASESGSGTLSGGVSGTLSYTRTGANVSMSGTVVVHGVPSPLVIGACVWSPTSIGPVVSAGWNCVWVIKNP